MISKNSLFFHTRHAREAPIAGAIRKILPNTDSLGWKLRLATYPKRSTISCYILYIEIWKQNSLDTGKMCPQSFRRKLGQGQEKTEKLVEWFKKGSNIPQVGRLVTVDSTLNEYGKSSPEWLSHSQTMKMRGSPLWTLWFMNVSHHATA